MALRVASSMTPSIGPGGAELLQQGFGFGQFRCRQLRHGGACEVPHPQRDQDGKSENEDAAEKAKPGQPHVIGRLRAPGDAHVHPA